jgi:hypothetical protein
MIDAMMLILVVAAFLLVKAYAELCNNLLVVAAAEDVIS